MQNIRYDIANFRGSKALSVDFRSLQCVLQKIGAGVRTFCAESPGGKRAAAAAFEAVLQHISQEGLNSADVYASSLFFCSVALFHFVNSCISSGN